MPRDRDLKVWWVPQMPGTAFEVPVDNLEQAAFVVNLLAKYDIFQFQQHIKPDYCNVGGLVVYSGDEWIDWYNDAGDDFDVWLSGWRSARQR